MYLNIRCMTNGLTVVLLFSCDITIYGHGDWFQQTNSVVHWNFVSGVSLFHNTYVEFLDSSIDLSKTKLKTVYINPTATNSVKIVKFQFYICDTLYVSYSLYQQHFNFLIYKMLKWN